MQFYLKKIFYMKNNIFVFFLFILLAFVVHAVVLKFIFPGYYSPLYPHHSDFYIPAAFAHAPGEYYSFYSLFFWPRPIYLIVAKCFGYLGIHGGIACIISLVFINCALSALFIKRVLNLTINWKLITAYVIYCGLLFSHPFLYTFYTQDLGAHISYFFLTLAAHLFYSTYKRSYILSNVILLACSLLAFLSKETYGLAALFFTFLWFFYYRKEAALYNKKNTVIKGLLPFAMVSIAFVVAYILNIAIKSSFVDPNSSADGPYHISLNPNSVLKELFLYLKESYNIANIIMVALFSYLAITNKNPYRKKILFITLACIASVGLSLFPNAILPNHHYSGYSFNATYLVYLPLLFVPILSVDNPIKKSMPVAIILLCLLSPLLNQKEYWHSGNDWVLFEEKTQRNLLDGLKPLLKSITPSKKPHKIVIVGINLPFMPFHYPECLRSFPNAKYAHYDVVHYNGALPWNGERTDLVKFINPPDVNKGDYEQKWIFDNEGKLVKSINLIAEKFNNKNVAQTDSSANKDVEINYDNLMQFTTTGFYGPENGLNWTNGNASITLNDAIEHADSITVQLSTYIPPKLNVQPRILLLDGNNKTFEPVVTTRKENVFYYQFVLDKNTSIQKINITSETFKTPPDERVLAFPVKSLLISSTGK
jgi:hypothetical protein